MSTSSARAGFTPAVIFAVGVTIFAWASAFVVIRGASVSFSPGAFALARLAVGTVFLAFVVIATRRWVHPTIREWLWIMAYGALWFAVYTFALNVAEGTLDAGTTAMIVGIGPILIAVGAGVFLRERLTKWVGIGVAVAFVGVVIIGLSSRSVDLSNGIGVIWAVLAAITYAAGVVILKPLLVRLPSGQVTFLGCAIGTLACLPFLGDLARDVVTAPLSAMGGAIYLGVVSTAIGLTTWGYALSRVPATQLGITTYVIPPLVIVMALVVFGEVPHLAAIAGGAICLIGVAISRRPTSSGQKDHT